MKTLDDDHLPGHDMSPLWPGGSQCFPQPSLFVDGTLSMRGAAGLVETQDIARVAFLREKRGRKPFTRTAFWRASLPRTCLGEASGARN